MVRQKVNSQTLQEKFPKIYEKLFSDCEIVISSCDSFFWSGEYVRFYGGLTLFQKVPVKIFVGLEVIPEQKVIFAEHLYGYAPYLDQFLDLKMEPAKEKRLIDFLNEYLRSSTKGRKFGLKVHILSEAHCGGGLGTTGVIMTCLAAAILLILDKINPREIEEIRQKNLAEQIQGQNSPFNRVFRFGWRLTAIARGGQSSGATCFGAMFSTSQPIAFISEGSDCVKDHPTVINWKNQFENCQIFEEISYWGGPLGDIFGFKDPLTWPVDIARIWSGSMVNTEHILKSISHIQGQLDQTREFILKPLAKNLAFPSTKEKPFFYLDAQRLHKDGFWREYVRVLNLTSVRILESFAGLFKGGSSEETLREFFAALDANHNMTQFLGTSTLVLDTICRFLIKEGFRVNETVGAGAKIEGIGKGGHVIFAFPAGELWDRIDKIIDQLANETKKDIWLDWASWLDGWGGEGIKIEQDIGEKKFSKFLAPDSVKINQWQNGNLIKSTISPRHDLDNLIKTSPIVLDQAHNKIYIKGRALTSKEIPSASGAISILAGLFKSPDLYLRNIQLPKTYAYNRYDLQSKIVIPLEKVIKKALNKELNMTIHGGMYDHYSLKFEPNSLEIILVEPLMMKV